MVPIKQTTRPLASPTTPQAVAQAVALAAAGHGLSHLEHRDGRSWFLFEPDARIAATATAYHTSQLQVDARGFADVLRGLKNAIHSAAPVQR